MEDPVKDDALLIQCHTEPCNLGAQAMSIQYHPEASPGPHDSDICFDQFIAMLVRSAARDAVRLATLPMACMRLLRGHRHAQGNSLDADGSLHMAMAVGAGRMGSKES